MLQQKFLDFLFSNTLRILPFTSANAYSEPQQEGRRDYYEFLIIKRVKNGTVIISFMRSTFMYVKMKYGEIIILIRDEESRVVCVAFL